MNKEASTPFSNSLCRGGEEVGQCSHLKVAMDQSVVIRVMVVECSNAG